MPLLRFRVFWEEDDQIYRDVEILTTHSFYDLHQIIIKSFDFDGKHEASFFEANDRWQEGREINSEVAINKKDAPALSMKKTPVTALIAKPDQKFVYRYDPAKQWTFQVALIAVSKDENTKITYPNVLRKEGIGPSQHGAKNHESSLLTEVEEKYDLSSDDMAEGYGNEGEENAGGDDGSHEF